ncbi:hypothetical protein FRB90_005529 [Tulasnella sp. 427]|nr:hypothetical protein FRB90_005529 [Tulasnella sp. 427]
MEPSLEELMELEEAPYTFVDEVRGKSLPTVACVNPVDHGKPVLPVDVVVPKERPLNVPSGTAQNHPGNNGAEQEHGIIGRIIHSITG